MKVARIILWLINAEMNDKRAKYVLSDELIVLSEDIAQKNPSLVTKYVMMYFEC